MTDAPMLNVPGIAEYLGFSVRAVKKWRGNTRRVLIAAGQLDAHAPTVPLPTNALPIPSNQAEHVALGVDPVWDREVIDRWARRTQRKDPLTGARTDPSPSGRAPDPIAA